MTRSNGWRAALCTLVGLAAASARAHAPPEISRIVWSPGGDRVVLVMNRGLIFGSAQAGTWSMSCGAALAMGAWEEPEVTYLPNGSLLAATSHGLRVTEDGGCAWRALAPFEGVAASALAQHPSEPSTLYVGVSGSAGSSIQKSLDGGAKWVQALALTAGERVTRLLFAPARPSRVYATVQLPGAGGAAASHALLRTSDTEPGWQRFAIQLQAEELRARIVAVSPRDPNLLLVHTLAADRQNGRDRILVSRDGGESYRELWNEVGLRDAGFGADGVTVWIAGDTGLWRSDEALMKVDPVGEAQLVTCLGVHDGALYLCGHHSGFDPVNAGVGRSTDGGQTFDRYMAFTEVTKQATCEPTSNAALACQADWTDWQLEVLVGLGVLPIGAVLPDAGLPDAGAREDAGLPAPSADAGTAGTAPMPMPRTARSGSGCTVARDVRAGFAELLAAWLFFILVGRRFERTRSRPRSSFRGERGA